MIDFRGGTPEVWLNDAVAPLGRPETDKLTSLLNPSIGATPITYSAASPCSIVTDLGSTPIEKSGIALTIRSTDLL